jgi:SpoVK/Ycf46/Vps4 family AAA+-type ATPase
LNEDHPGLLLVATANDITSLRNNHPELLRKGRFDEIWFSDVPNVEERAEIFSIHLKKSGRDPKKFDLAKLSEYEYVDNDGQKFTLTGAEIKSSIEDAKRNKFAKFGGNEIEIGGKDDISTDDILECLKRIKPITKIGKEKISSMRKWSEDNATNVSAGLPKTEKKKSNKTKVNLRETDIEL